MKMLGIIALSFSLATSVNAEIIDEPFYERVTIEIKTNSMDLNYQGYADTHGYFTYDLEHLSENALYQKNMDLNGDGYEDVVIGMLDRGFTNTGDAGYTNLGFEVVFKIYRPELSRYETTKIDYRIDPQKEIRFQVECKGNHAIIVKEVQKSIYVGNYYQVVPVSDHPDNESYEAYYEIFDISGYKATKYAYGVEIVSKGYGSSYGFYEGSRSYGNANECISKLRQALSSRGLSYASIELLNWKNRFNSIVLADCQTIVINGSAAAYDDKGVCHGSQVLSVVDRSKDQAACTVFGFCPYAGKRYWYEDGGRQGIYGDKKNIYDTWYGNLERGREIYDPISDAWYWLDAVYDGAAAYNKEVWMPYIFQTDLAYGINPQGKWVRYDSHGAMIKGWYTVDGTDAYIYPEQSGNTYYYDLITGEMFKGIRTINNVNYHFDELTGALIR